MGNGKQKYRLGLKPIYKDEWINRKIGPNLYEHRKNYWIVNIRMLLLLLAIHLKLKELLGQKFNLKKVVYKDLIADMSLLIQDDLCLIRANGDQELLAASICSPSYWNLKSKIGKPLKDIHINNRKNWQQDFYSMKKFARQNWLIHGDTFIKQARTMVYNETFADFMRIG